MPADYEETIEQWRQDRMANLIAPTGWLSLVGLHWLSEGENSFGSASEMDITMQADVPKSIGTYTLANDEVSAEIDPSSGVEVSEDGISRMSYGSVQWFLLERGGQYGIRVRDTLLPARISLRPIPYYDIDPSYRAAAQFTPAQEDASLMMRNVLDMEYEVPVEGKLSFSFGGKEHEIVVLSGGPDDLFLIISDETTGAETYGGGRYIYCPRPDEDGQTIIDFNKAYNPPCAFTDFATCLLPLEQNHLSVEITAGEKNYGDH